MPLSMRQESTDIVFTALLEDDENPMAHIAPMAGYEPEGPGVAMQEKSTPELVDELMRASMDQTRPSQPTVATPPMGPREQGPQGAPQQRQAAPQGAPQPQQGAGPSPADLEALMGLM